MIIAIDFDGTITENKPFPITANIRQEARIYIPKLYQLGHKLILWTARKEPYYSECIQQLKKEKLFQYFTSNYEVGVTGKVEADIYLDDRSSIGDFNWNLWYNYILSKVKEE